MLSMKSTREGKIEQKMEWNRNINLLTYLTWVVYLKRCFDAERFKNNNCKERNKSACFNSFNKMTYSNESQPVIPLLLSSKRLFSILRWKFYQLKVYFRLNLRFLGLLILYHLLHILCTCAHTWLNTWKEYLQHWSNGDSL